MIPLFEVVVNQNAEFLVDWGADPGVRNQKGEREGSFFLEGGRDIEE